MIHIRTDDSEWNADAKFVCGIKWPLPDGDKYWFAHDFSADRADCPGCNPAGPRKLGTPLSKVTGAQLDRIAEQWRGEHDHEPEA